MPRASAISWDYPFDKKPIYKKSESSDTWAEKRNYLQKRRQWTDRVMQVFKNQKNIFLLSRWTLFALEVLFNIELLTSIGYSVGGGGAEDQRNVGPYFNIWLIFVLSDQFSWIQMEYFCCFWIVLKRECHNTPACPIPYTKQKKHRRLKLQVFEETQTAHILEIANCTK